MSSENWKDIAGEFVEGFVEGAIEALTESDDIEIVEVEEIQVIEKQEVQTTQTKEVQRVKINSLEEMESFLTDLQATASDSLAAALSAQLQVIRYVNSPELVCTTIDTLLQNLKKAKEYAATPKERDLVMERGTLMVQNYVFFLKAKLNYAIEDNKEEGHRLFTEAGVQLTKCVAVVALAAATGGVSATVGAVATEGLIANAGAVAKGGVKIAIAKNLFENREQNAGLISRLSNWWNKEKNNEKKRKDFYKGLHSLINKLHKKKDIVGQSDIIAGLIENYTEELADFATEETQIKLEKIPTKKKWTKAKMWTFSVLIFVTSLVILLGRWIWHGIHNLGTAAVSLVSEDVERVTRDGWVATHFMWTFGFIGLAVLIGLIHFLSHIIQGRALKRAIEKQRNEIRKYYNDIAASFEE